MSIYWQKHLYVIHGLFSENMCVSELRVIRMTRIFLLVLGNAA